MTKRIIPCLDIRDGRVVKGKKFKDVQDVANAIELAKQYEVDQAAWLFLLDISGADRTHFLHIIKKVSEQTTFLLLLGHGIHSLAAIRDVLEAGADEVSITSAAIEQPTFLQEAVAEFGGDRIILSIDAQSVADQTRPAFIKGGKEDTGIDVIEWAKQGEQIGVSEILLNSIDADGVKAGDNLALNVAVTIAISFPVIDIEAAV